LITDILNFDINQTIVFDVVFNVILRQPVLLKPEYPKIKEHQFEA